MQSRTTNLTLWLIATALLFPLFIQFSGGIFNSEVFIIDSKGILSTLPLPISIIACLFGIFVFSRNYRQATQAIVFISALVAAILLSVMFSGESHGVDMRKAILAAQFLLPTMGLFFGQLVHDEDNIVPRAFMWVLLLLVPFQLLAGWSQHTLTLTHYLYVFSIYQHFQFVPVIFVMAFCLVMLHLWVHYKVLLRILTFIMGVYVISSASFLAIGAYCCFVLEFFLRRILGLQAKRMAGLVAFGAGIAVAVAVVGVYIVVAKNSTAVVDNNGQYTGKFGALAEGKLPINVVQRLSDWKLYGDWIVESKRTLVFGHIAPPPREVKTSAHNWYLDFAYNFGLIALLPILSLIIFTSWQIWRFRKYLPEQTLWLAGLVAFLVLIDSNFKVTLRQPYPGIFAFFLWGLLLSRLRPGLAIKAGS